ncbi:twitching motility protein PilT [Spirochaetia bacterium]|nr:twitching motility protein PilT [Spirochaetia bacterium]
MVALIDTNVIIDALVNREPFAAKACALLSLCAKNYFLGYFAAHTIPDIFYILRKDYTGTERKDMLLGVCRVLDVVVIDKVMLVSALNDAHFDDVEDCLQAECAVSINADYIVTRNIDDFSASTIPAILPEDFLVKIEAAQAQS